MYGVKSITNYRYLQWGGIFLLHRPKMVSKFLSCLHSGKSMGFKQTGSSAFSSSSVFQCYFQVGQQVPTERSAACCLWCRDDRNDDPARRQSFPYKQFVTLLPWDWPCLSVVWATEPPRDRCWCTDHQTQALLLRATQLACGLSPARLSIPSGSWADGE